jgi:hypothetical protein
MIENDGPFATLGGETYLQGIQDQDNQLRCKLSERHINFALDVPPQAPAL